MRIGILGWGLHDFSFSFYLDLTQVLVFYFKIKLLILEQTIKSSFLNLNINLFKIYENIRSF